MCLTRISPLKTHQELIYTLGAVYLYQEVKVSYFSGTPLFNTTETLYEILIFFLKGPNVQRVQEIVNARLTPSYTN